jgi:flagellar motor protein MotB
MTLPPMQQKISYYLLFSFIVFIFFSCVPQKKVASVKKELTTVNTQLQQNESSLKTLDDQRKNKQDQNEIDDSASLLFQKFIDSTSSETKALISQNEVLIGETVVNKTDWERLNKNLFLSQQTSKKIDQKVMMLTDLINRNTVIRLDQDLLFEPGKYTVTSAVADAIGKFFEPAAKEIDLFVKKYPDFPLSLIFTAKGYADGTAISEGTPLYKDLMARLKLTSTPLDDKELNKELSRARAESVIALFKQFTVDRKGNGANVKNIAYLYEGKGDALPNSKITDYKADDARRRIVLLYWSVLPDY